MLPITILQFGAGRFLRAFADFFVHEANEAGQALGRIAVVQSTGDDRAIALNRQGGVYHVLLRGVEDGQIVERMQTVASIAHCYHAGTEWPAIRDIARSPDLRIVLSNTTEAGFALDRTDTIESAPPAAFPAKLLSLLLDRFRAHLPGLTIIPCELMEGNAALLKSIIMKLAEQWQLDPAFIAWLRDDCVWLETLVDRIVSGTPAEHPMLAEDPMLLAAEPYALFALQTHPRAAPFATHPAIIRTPDVQPYFLRKVRILNAAHTALLIASRPRGYALVREAMGDAELVAWLERLLFDEIVPTLEGRIDQGELFARQTLDRFRNPFLDHQFSAIAANHATKVEIRLASTQQEFVTRFGRRPPLLDAIIAASDSVK